MFQMRRGRRGQGKHKKLSKNAVEHAARFVLPIPEDLEDLTDDRAPNMLGEAGQPQTSQAPVSADNKLNFKFQKTAPKPTDWSQYQNKFKRIGGGSPDVEDAEGEGVVKQEPNQSANTGCIFEEDVEMKEAPVNNQSYALELRVAVTTEPFQYLTVDQVKEVKDGLSNRIQDAIFNENRRSYIPAFEENPQNDFGYLPLKCSGPKDLRWLHETLPSIPTPLPFAKLTIIPQTDVPDMTKIKIIVPAFPGNLADLQYLLQKQNSWYDMSSWTLVRSEKYGNDPWNYTLIYSIPKMQALIIDNRDRRIAYSLGNLFVADASISVSENVFNHRNKANHLQVCVSTEPFKYLTLLEVELIKLALAYQIEKDTFETETEEYIPAFRSCPCHFKGGLKLWCESDRDLTWLKNAIVPLASPAIGTKLVIREQTSMPYRAKIKVTVPSTDDEAVVVKVLKSQNSWCDIEAWALFCTDTSPQGLVLIFYVPHKHMNLIRQKKFRLSYLLGYADVDLSPK